MRIRQKAIKGYRKAKKEKYESSRELMAKALEALAKTKELQSEIMKMNATDVEVKEVK